MKMNLIEMEGCLPGDMKTRERNAEYLVRKFSELQEQLSESQREFRSADITMQNLEAKCEKLAAENACLKQSKPSLKTMMSALDVFYVDEDVPESAMLAAYNILRGAVETPATDAFLNEFRAQGVELAITHIVQTISPNHETILNEFSAQLRNGDAQ